MSEEEIVTMRLRIEGVVQGVGYRAFAAAEARRLGLTGWVRNRSDRSVEALVSGAGEDVESFVAACTRGPAGARVTSVDLQKAEPREHEDFRQRPTL